MMNPLIELNWPVRSIHSGNRLRNTLSMSRFAQSIPSNYVRESSQPRHTRFLMLCIERLGEAKAGSLARHSKQQGNLNPNLDPQSGDSNVQGRVPVVASRLWYSIGWFFVG